MLQIIIYFSYIFNRNFKIEKVKFNIFTIVAEEEGEKFQWSCRIPHSYLFTKFTMQDLLT